MPEKMIPYNQLCKAAYNRVIQRSWVNEIKRGWRDDLENPLVVSYRGGKYWIIDHQHQALAKYELNGCDPNMLFRCDVRTGLTYQQESDLYYSLNTRTKKLSFVDRLIGLIESGNANAIKFKETVELCGWVIGKNSLNAAEKAWGIFNTANGAKRLAEILTTANTCWPGESSGVQSQMLDGFSAFFRNHPDYKKDRLIKALSQYQPSELMQKANSYYKQMDSRAFTKQYCTYAIIVNAYNKGLRGNNKLVPVAPVM